MSLNQENESNKSTRPASSSELNSWKRGFTPQAEIWNGQNGNCRFNYFINYSFSIKFNFFWLEKILIL